jgi:hypothetical protein
MAFGCPSRAPRDRNGGRSAWPARTISIIARLFPFPCRSEAGRAMSVYNSEYSEVSQTGGHFRPREFHMGRRMRMPQSHALGPYEDAQFGRARALMSPAGKSRPHVRERGRTITNARRSRLDGSAAPGGRIRSAARGDLHLHFLEHMRPFGSAGPLGGLIPRKVASDGEAGIICPSLLFRVMRRPGLARIVKLPGNVARLSNWALILPSWCQTGHLLFRIGRRAVARGGVSP